MPGANRPTNTYKKFNTSTQKTASGKKVTVTKKEEKKPNKQTKSGTGKAPSSRSVVNNKKDVPDYQKTAEYKSIVQTVLPKGFEGLPKGKERTSLLGNRYVENADGSRRYLTPTGGNSRAPKFLTSRDQEKKAGMDSVAEAAKKENPFIGQGPMINSARGKTAEQYKTNIDAIISGQGTLGSAMQDAEYVATVSGLNDKTRTYMAKAYAAADSKEKAKLAYAMAKSNGYTPEVKKYIQQLDETGNNELTALKRQDYYANKDTVDAWKQYNVDAKATKFLEDWGKENYDGTAYYIDKALNGASNFTAGLIDAGAMSAANLINESGDILKWTSTKDIIKPGDSVQVAIPKIISKIVQNYLEVFSVPWKMIFNAALSDAQKQQAVEKLTSLTDDYYRRLRFADAEQSNVSAAKKKVGEFITTITEQIPGVAASILNPAVGLAVFSTSAGGRYARQAYNEGADLNDAVTYGILAGAAEGGTEKLFTGFGVFGKGVSSAITKKLGTSLLYDTTINSLKANNFAGSIQGKILKGVLAAGGEATEEMVMEIATPFIKRGTYDENADPATLKEIADAGVMGAAVSAVLGLPYHAVNITRGDETQRKVSKIENNRDEALAALDVKVALGKITPEEAAEHKQSITATAAEAIDYYKGRGALSKGVRNSEEKQTGTLATVSADMEGMQSSLNEQAKEAQPGATVSAAMVTDEGTKVYSAEVQTDGTLGNLQETAAGAEQEAYTQKAQAINKAQAAGDEITASALQHNVKDSVTKLATDISAATGRKIRFFSAEEITDTEGKKSTINGYYDGATDTIYVNARSKNASTQIIAHELTHSLEANKDGWEQLRNTVYEWYKNSAPLERKRIEALYERTGKLRQTGSEAERQGEIDREVIAAYVEKHLLTDEQSIRRVTEENPSLARRILNWLNDLITKVAGSKEGKFLIKTRDLYAKVLNEGRTKKAESVIEKGKNVQKKNKAAAAGVYSISKNDLQEYLEAGNRKNKAKTENLEKGNLIILESQEEAESFIRKAILGEVDYTAAYGRAEEKLIKDVKRVAGEKGLGEVDLSGMFLELVASDLKHAYIEHKEAKEAGDIDLTMQDFLKIPEYPFTYDVVEDVRKKGNGQIRIVLSEKNDNGRIVIIQLTSKSRGALQLKTLWGNTEEKYQEKFGQEKGNTPFQGAAYNGTSTEESAPAQGVSTDNMPQEKKNVKGADRQKRKYSISEEDNSRYMKAIESGDMDTAQQMVDEAAEEWAKNSKIREKDGKLIRVYHGTVEDFTVFDRTKSRANMDIQGNFFSPWEEDAAGYGTNVKAYYLNITNPATESVGYSALKKHAGENNAGVSARDDLIAKGYNGVNNNDEEYIAFESNQIKSADPVTYDDKGKVIPLSERFDKNKNDIRYSISEDSSGRRVVLLTGDSLQKHKSGRVDHKTLRNYLRGHIGDVYPIFESGRKVYVGKDLPNEYIYSKSAQRLDVNRFNAKAQASANMNEIIEIATNRRWEKSEKKRHEKDAKYGWYKYDSRFAVPVYDEQGFVAASDVYDATVLIRNDADGKKYLYDLINMKRNASASVDPSKWQKAISGSEDTGVSKDSIRGEFQKVNGKDRQNVKFSVEESIPPIFEEPPKDWDMTQIYSMPEEDAVSLPKMKFTNGIVLPKGMNNVLPKGLQYAVEEYGPDNDPLGKFTRRDSEDPREQAEYKAMVGEYADELWHVLTVGEIDDAFGWVTKLTGGQTSGVTNSKHYGRVFDAAAFNQPKLRQKLKDLFEKPFWAAKQGYIKGIKEILDDMQKKMKKLGIKKDSKEDKAIQKYGEGYYLKTEVGEDPQTKKKILRNVKVEYTLEDLKKECPQTWEKVVEADQYFRKIYDDYIGKINDARMSIYGNVRQAHEAEIKKANDKLELYRHQITGLRDKIKGIEKGLSGKKAELKEMETRHAKHAHQNPDYGAKARAKLEKTIRYNEELMINQQADLDAIRNRVKHQTNILRKLHMEERSGSYMANKMLVPRERYYRHAQEDEKFRLIQEVINLSRNTSEIDPTLEGISADTQPLAKWSSILAHQGKGMYKLSAIGGMLDYVQAAEYIIHMDPMIAEMRNNIKAIAEATRETKNANRLIRWLVNWTNDLAGKTNPVDRVVQDALGRNKMRFIRKINSRVKANAVVGNLNSAVVQFMNLPNMLAHVQNARSWTNGLKDYLMWLGKNEDARKLLQQSTFLNERYLDRLINSFDEGIMKNPKKLAVWALTVGDQQSAILMWFTAYNEAMRKKIKNPIEWADDMTQRSVGGRGIGELPLTQKSLVTQVFAPFQVEVNNAWQLYKEQVKKIIKGKGAKTKISGASGLGAVLVANFMANTVVDMVLGRRVIFDPIYVFLECLVEWSTADDDEKEETNWVQRFYELMGKEMGEIIESMPFGSLIAYYAVNNPWQRTQIFGGEDNDPTRYGVSNIAVEWLVNFAYDLSKGKNLSDSAISFFTTFITPWGGKQLNRMIVGAQNLGISSDHGPGVYDDKGNLKFPMEDFKSSPAQAILGLVFGQYTTKIGREYIANKSSALSEKETALYEELVKNGADGFEVYDLLQNMKGEKVYDKRNLLIGSELTGAEKRDVFLALMVSSDTMEDNLSKLDAWDSIGGSFDDYLHFLNMKADISATKPENLQGALTENLLLNGYSPDEANAMMSVFYKSGAGKALELTEYGVDAETSMSIMQTLSGLTPANGKSVTQVEKLNAIVGMKLKEDTTKAAFRYIMNDTAYAKYDIATKHGLPSSVYMEYEKALRKADMAESGGNGNGKVNKEEVIAALNSLNASQEAKNALYTLASARITTAEDGTVKLSGYTDEGGYTRSDAVLEEYHNAKEGIEKKETEEKKFIIPVNFKRISSGFGPRSSPGGIGSTNHKGIDLAAPTGTPVGAATAGTVTFAGAKGGYGNAIVIETTDADGNKIATLYGHLSTIGVKTGDIVTQGKQIGEVGSTGNSTGPHLHFSTIVNGQQVDPETLLDFGRGKRAEGDPSYNAILSGGSSGKSAGSGKTTKSSSKSAGGTENTTGSTVKTGSLFDHLMSIFFPELAAKTSAGTATGTTTGTNPYGIVLPKGGTQTGTTQKTKTSWGA